MGKFFSGALLAGARRVHIPAIARLGLLHRGRPRPGLLSVLVWRRHGGLSLALIVSRLRKPEGRDINRLAVRRACVGYVAAFALGGRPDGPLGFLTSFALLTFFTVAVVFKRPLATAGATASSPRWGST